MNWDDIYAKDIWPPVVDYEPPAPEIHLTDGRTVEVVSARLPNIARILESAGWRRLPVKS
jgi:hypothetical protein